MSILDQKFKNTNLQKFDNAAGGRGSKTDEKNKANKSISVTRFGGQKIQKHRGEQ